MNKISTKLAICFFIAVFIMEAILMTYLHQSMIQSRVNEEFARLLSNGSNHRNVLIENYSDTTIKHIVMMEKDIDREVIITNNRGEIISRSSGSVLEKFHTIIMNLDYREDSIVISDWKKSSYIVSAHPFQADGDKSGYVVMFQSTGPIKEMIHKLNMHFAASGVISIIILFVVYAILSKLLTRPLIKMKEATEKISMGDFNVSLPYLGEDELGDLSSSIQKLAKDLEHLKNERNEFLASIAHELSTPLTYIIGYSKIAMRDGITDEERASYLKIIAEESERVKELVKNLLDLARMDETTFTISKEQFNARPFFENVYKLVQPSYEMKNIKLNLICKEDFLIYADPIRLEQIVLNLLDNAYKYSNEESEVTLEVQKNENKTVISVIDSGIGIPEDEIDLIFEKLYRVEKSRSRLHGGSGIGLVVVKELVEAHGGTIEVKSKLGEGSIFKITI